MPIPLRVPDDSPLMDTLSLVVLQLRTVDDVRVDDAWLQHHGCRVKPYARFRDEFELLLRTVVRARFVAERKHDEFALTISGHVRAYAELSLRDYDQAVIFSRV